MPLFEFEDLLGLDTQPQDPNPVFPLKDQTDPEPASPEDQFLYPRPDLSVYQAYMFAAINSFVASSQNPHPNAKVEIVNGSEYTGLRREHYGLEQEEESDPPVTHFRGWIYRYLWWAVMEDKEVDPPREYTYNFMFDFKWIQNRETLIYETVINTATEILVGRKLSQFRDPTL